jgi:phosphate transport system substrate-binding protein
MKHLLILAAAMIFTAQASAITKVNGAGASFPYPIYSKWFSEYKKVKTDVEFNYQAIGSGGGIRQLIKQTVDFGASDAPMKEKDMKKAAWPVLHVPTVMGAVSVAFNLDGVKDLKVDGPTLAKIFMGSITKWNDPALVALNKGVNLPNADILVVRRSDGSGTTAIFSDYLSTVSPEFKKKVGKGKALKWPATTVGAKGNDGVTGVVKQTKGSVGYVELAYAIKNGLPTAKVKNKNGKFTAPSIKGVSASAAKLKDADYNGDLRISIVDQAGDDVYPISAFTYILLPVTKETTQLKEVKNFLNWALTKGQAMAGDLHYAPLPSKLTKVLLKKIK